MSFTVNSIWIFSCGSKVNLDLFTFILVFNIKISKCAINYEYIFIYAAILPGYYLITKTSIQGTEGPQLARFA